MSSIGISSLGLALPGLAIDVRTLAALRGMDPDKATIGLGCRVVALAGPDEDASTLAARAAARAIARWGGDPGRIGLVAVGTESAKDMSRPTAMPVMEALGLRGAIRAYEVKHACYGGTLALRQAVEWRQSGASRGRVALVIASDIARYEPGSAAEPTMGAGAVAMIVDEGRIAAVEDVSHAWSAPAFDFWRPAGEAYPRVDGKLSLECYHQAVIETFRAMAGGGSVAAMVNDAAAACFHVPFPKMVRKAFAALAEAEGWSDAEAAGLWESRVAPTMGWNLEVGNAYTASLWIAVAHTLCRRSAGDRVLAFSYGSGFGAELLGLVTGDHADGAWAADIEADLAARTMLDADAYVALRGQDPRF